MFSLVCNRRNFGLNEGKVNFIRYIFTWTSYIWYCLLLPFFFNFTWYSALRMFEFWFIILMSRSSSFTRRSTLYIINLIKTFIRMVFPILCKYFVNDSFLEYMLQCIFSTSTLRFHSTNHTHVSPLWEIKYVSVVGNSKFLGNSDFSANIILFRELLLFQVILHAPRWYDIDIVRRHLFLFLDRKSMFKFVFHS